MVVTFVLSRRVSYEPRQARKGAAAVVLSSAEMWRVLPPPIYAV